MSSTQHRPTPPTRPTDDAVRAALVREPGRELILDAAASIGSLVRATPQRRRSFMVWPRAGDQGMDGWATSRPVLIAVTLGLLVVAAIGVAFAASLLLRPPLPVNGLIVFGSDRGGLVAVDPIHGESRELVSPWEMSASGRTERSDLIAWSPDGRRLAHIQTLADSWSIHVVDADTGDPMQVITLARDAFFPEWGFEWTGDGAAFILAATSGGVPAILRVDATSGVAELLHPEDASGFDPALSTDGRRLAYVRTSRKFTTDYRLVVSDVHGRDERDLLATLPDGARVDGSPAWSPDGALVGVTVRHPDGSYALARVRTDGGDPTRITPWTSEWVEGRWSPDGTRLLVATSPQGGRAIDAFATGDLTGELHTMAPDGSDRRLLASGSCPGARWSPDGRSIVFQSCGAGPDTVEIRMIDADGSNERVLWSADRRSMGAVSVGWQALPPD